MQKNLIRFLFFFLTIFLTGFISYSQNWANNLRSQQLSKGDLTASLKHIKESYDGLR